MISTTIIAFGGPALLGVVGAAVAFYSGRDNPSSPSATADERIRHINAAMEKYVQTVREVYPDRFGRFTLQELMDHPIGENESTEAATLKLMLRRQAKLMEDVTALLGTPTSDVTNKAPHR